MYGNGRPLGMRKRIQVLVAVVLLAWATQTLLHQWGFGNDLSAQERAAADRPAPSKASERFVPGTGRFAAGATLELRTEATVLGTEVKLKQVCRWSKGDDAVFAPLADLVLVRFDEGQPFRPVTLEQIRSTLHDAGVNLAVVRFAGPTSCTVARSDAEYDENEALLQWANAKQGEGSVARENKTPTERNAPAPAAAEPAADVARAGANEEAEPTLKSLLVRDLALRF